MMKSLLMTLVVLGASVASAESLVCVGGGKLVTVDLTRSADGTYLSAKTTITQLKDGKISGETLRGGGKTTHSQFSKGFSVNLKNSSTKNDLDYIESVYDGSQLSVSINGVVAAFDASSDCIEK